MQFSGTTVHGFSSSCEENREAPLDFNNFLVRHRSTTFCLKVASDAMSPAIIKDDILVTDRSLGVKNGDIVVAEYNGEFTVRYLLKDNGNCILKAENPVYPDIRFSSETGIFGVVTAVIRKTR